jgi:hypothetical protein
VGEEDKVNTNEEGEKDEFVKERDIPVEETREITSSPNDSPNTRLIHTTLKSPSFLTPVVPSPLSTPSKH